MRIFGFDVRRASKSYGVTDLARDVGFGFGGISVIDPLKIIAEAFAGNATVFAATMKTAGAAAAIPWLPQAKARDGALTDVATDHELARLVARPSAWCAWPQLVEAMVGSLMLFGEGYLYLNGPGNPLKDPAPGRPPTEVLWIPTQWVEVVENERTMEVLHYKLNTRNGVVEIPPHRMVAPKFWNPASPWRGQGRVRASAASIDTVNEGRKWHRNLLMKGARPPGVLTSDSVLTDAVYQRMLLQRDRELGGASNAGKIPILEGGLKWQSTGMTATDLDFLGGLQEAKREISVAFGVDPGAMGDPMVKTYANYSEARRALYEDTVLPIVHLIRLTLEARLQAWWPDTCFLLEEDRVPALREAKRAEWRGYGELVTGGLLTRNEARELMGYEEVEGGDEILVSLAVVPLRDAVAPAEPEPAADPAKPKPPQKPGKEDEEDEFAQG